MSLFRNNFVEVLIVLAFLNFLLSVHIMKNFLIYRTCYVSLGYNESDCVLLGTSNKSDAINKLEQDVEPLASVILMARNVLNSFLPPIFVCILGPWSNKHGRKPIFLYSFIGMLLTNLLCACLTSIYWASPWWIVVIMFVTSFCGGLCLFCNACCYIVDITNESNRSIRMTIMEMSAGTSRIIATLSSAYIFYSVGYTGVFIINIILTLIGIFYIQFCLVESLPVIEKENRIKDLFDYTIIIETIKITFKKRMNYKTTLLCLFFYIMFIDVFVDVGEESTLFLYLRERFHWSLTQYTLVLGFAFIFEIVTNSVTITILHKTRINDITIMFVCFVCTCCSSLCYAFAISDWHIYAGFVLRRTRVAFVPLAHSAMSKLVSSKDLGSVFAVSLAIESSGELLITPLYVVIYNATLITHSNAFNFLSVVAYASGIIASGIIVYIRNFRQSKESVNPNEFAMQSKTVF